MARDDNRRNPQHGSQRPIGRGLTERTRASIAQITTFLDHWVELSIRLQGEAIRCAS